jgi:hypothetical protein
MYAPDVIVVVGSPRASASANPPVAAAGLAADIAAAAAAAGAGVQIVGRVGEDAAGDAIVLDLARRSVGHVAVLRDAGRSTAEMWALPVAELGVEADPGPVSDGESLRPTLEAADIELALSYLTEYAVIVVAEPLAAAALRVVADATAWSGARLVVVGAPDDLTGLPDDATVFAPPDDGDPDGAFAAMVGAYAAGLDRGDDPKAAFAAATSAVGSNRAD